MKSFEIFRLLFHFLAKTATLKRNICLFAGTQIVSWTPLIIWRTVRQDLKTIFSFYFLGNFDSNFKFSSQNLNFRIKI